MSFDAWFTLSIDAAWRVSIDSSLVDLRIVRESAGSFFEEPINLLYIVVPGTKMYVPETEEKKIYQFFFRIVVKPRLNLIKQDIMAIKPPRQRRQILYHSNYPKE